ncbi:MAG: RHS repeat-associated core domain-containing protein [Bacteroidales bacterium]|nr:RHS repeat-associated core domain-containing protein [Bacteroidales bacterium]
MENRGKYGRNRSVSFTGKEKDEETGYSYFGARYYDSDLSGLFLSVDPMSDKYPSISPYAYCAWNPVKYIDPNGEWIPGLDENNNVVLTAEDGDDINTLRDFMGDAYRDVIECLYGTMSNGVINLTESYGCVFQEMTDAINNSPTNDVNCWGTSMSILTNGVVDPHYRYNGKMIAKKMDADVILVVNGISVPKSDANVGNTLVRFSNSGENGKYPGETTHFATYMGTDLKGQQYVFTKNGWKYNWDIQKIDDFHVPDYEHSNLAGTRFNDYGIPTPLIGHSTPYYNKR